VSGSEFDGPDSDEARYFLHPECACIWLKSFTSTLFDWTLFMNLDANAFPFLAELPKRLIPCLPTGRKVHLIAEKRSERRAGGAPTRHGGSVWMRSGAMISITAFSCSRENVPATT